MKLKYAAVIAAVLVTHFSTAHTLTGTKTMDDTAILSTIKNMTDSFAAGDMEAILAAYEEGATVVGQPGHPVSGDKELRAMFQQFIDKGVAFTYGAHDVVVSGDIALHLMKWTAPTPEGDMSALSVAVLRRQGDGTWKMAIDHPFGDAVMHAPSVQ